MSVNGGPLRDSGLEDSLIALLGDIVWPRAKSWNCRRPSSVKHKCRRSCECPETDFSYCVIIFRIEDTNLPCVLYIFISVATVSLSWVNFACMRKHAILQWQIAGTECCRGKEAGIDSSKVCAGTYWMFAWSKMIWCLILRWSSCWTCWVHVTWIGGASVLHIWW